MEIGFDHLVFQLPPEPEENVLPILDGYAKLAESLR